jgi:hypothetical protein
VEDLCPEGLALSQVKILENPPFAQAIANEANQGSYPKEAILESHQALGCMFPVPGAGSFGRLNNLTEKISQTKHNELIIAFLLARGNDFVARCSRSIK